LLDLPDGRRGGHYLGNAPAWAHTGSKKACSSFVQFFYVHADPFLRLGMNGIKKSLGR
jgi:hypothetical protein